MEEESKLEKFKKDYEVLRAKHGLPEFNKMNEDFQIEKISENETDILIREVRKFVGDKIVNYMRFVESLLNPVNAPMFTLSLVKLLGAEERSKLQGIYKDLMRKEVSFIERDIQFDEVKEAEFIRDSFKLWQEIKKDLALVMGEVDRKWDEEKIAIDSNGYFG